MIKRILVEEGIMREGPEGVTLLGNKCRSCGQIFFPKAQFCLNCDGNQMEEIPLSRKGKLYSYTIGRMPSMHFEAPYGLGYVDLPEGIRIFSPLAMVEDKPFKVGMEMEVISDKLWQEGGKLVGGYIEQTEVMGYKFRPV
jgi:uncharacterized OB-fold protein